MHRVWNEAILPIVVGLALALWGGYFIYTQISQKKGDFFRTDTPVVQIGKNPIRVIVASTTRSRIEGLGGYAPFPEKTGMLFIFDSSDYHPIWMKDMLFSIDIIWIDDSLHVVDIRSNVSPETYPTIFEPKVRSRFVLETPALYTAAYQIRVGDKVTLPHDLTPKDLK